MVVRDAKDSSEREQVELISTLRVTDLILARACSDGNETAWEAFLLRFRVPLYDAAYRMTRDDATGRELADAIYADLYGISNRDGRRQCKFDYYMGRGSLEGWLRTVLSREYVNRYRSRYREVSLDQQLEAGVEFEGSFVTEPARPDDRLGAAVRQSLAEVSAEDRFLLASWYLDQRTLADIGRQMSVHESTVSRRLDRITATLRKRIRKQLQDTGIGSKECEELMTEIDVRDSKYRCGSKFEARNATGNVP